ncbi:MULTISPECIES: carboxylesterase/lipase family protein [Corynebacterium]|jgi:carboxylesterase type B|uniref:carboxylesterase/lipase family protein n=1 Tax=Corynebacterium TaxID=1716 RepID=UPI000398EACB|nr:MULTISPECIES: carboxylesterase/lipase family protein [Corynebacterium]ERS38748.1 hypothetical protein HMPREF1292_01931 [Corynebacterium sp. KPL1995]ERS71172.1 hypothetical protein HMPREF1290_01949 [Corynebacterium sp. KPL1989]MDC7067433.1 carboxylesterase/lipase family protein [Corynebacterium pseudodiphtheriticum]MDC7083499.1 carboxylesterase/lipase family protein [Corynebacterium pseudodiphtheriticum]MDC7085525.1 carboxylesterase/lipase family protein [Corynebacterium pseudodiphtheriticum
MDESSHLTSDYPRVRISSGEIQGEFAQDGTIAVWKGVPFGAPTGGAGRFRRPKPPRPWQGILDCTRYQSPAPQPNYGLSERLIGDEDCLHLDIVRPHSVERLPVVVYFHGGSFLMGASHQNMLRGYRLARVMNVVYVSLNFRLGVLGYLDLRSLGGDCVANPALWDQVLALEWVRENIAQFGGDPDSVTIMGESAGGAAVLALLCSPPAHGLFHRAIAQSPPIGLIHSKAQSQLWARQLLTRLGLSHDSTVEDLRTFSADELVRAGMSMMWRAGELQFLNSTFGPTVESESLPEHPMVAFQHGRQARVPLMLGTNLDEAGITRYFFQRTARRAKAGRRLLYPYDPEHTDTVLKAYGGARSRAEFADLVTDALFWAPTVRIASHHNEVAPTWMYRFDFAPQLMRKLGIGAAHSAELSNVFGTPEASKTRLLSKVGRDDEAMQRLTAEMQRHWASFISSGQPGSDWPQYKPPTDQHHSRPTMVFDAQSRVEYDPKADKRRAWKGYNVLEWGAGRPELLRDLGFRVDD